MFHSIYYLLKFEILFLFLFCKYLERIRCARVGGSARQGGTERGLGVCRVRVKVPYARERDGYTEKEREG